MARKKRVVIRVTWNPRVRRWHLSRTSFVTSEYYTKLEAVRVGAAWGRQTWRDGALAQLVVHNKGGRISFERTYGRDPRRFKG